MHFDSLEPRRHLSVTLADNGSGILTITGGNGNNFIGMYGIKDSYVVRVSGEIRLAFKKDEIKQVIVYGYAGNDQININTRVQAIIHGGEGNDNIRGGKADDILIGGAGRDRLEGREGNDILRGDSGNDTLIGGAGDDILYGGADEKTPSGGLATNTYNGGTGTDIVMATANEKENPKKISIETTEAETYRPAGRAFPESLSYIDPKLSAVTGTGSNGKPGALVTLSYTLPNTATKLLFPTDNRLNDPPGEGGSTAGGIQRLERPKNLKLTGPTYLYPLIVLSSDTAETGPTQRVIEISNVTEPGTYNVVLSGSGNAIFPDAASGTSVFVAQTTFSIAPITG